MQNATLAPATATALAVPAPPHVDGDALITDPVAYAMVAFADVRQLNAKAACTVHPWCVETGEHEFHNSAEISLTFPDPGYDPQVVLDARLVAEDDHPSGCKGCDPAVAFCGADMTPAQVRAKVAEIRAHLAKVEALADQLAAKAAR